MFISDTIFPSSSISLKNDTWTHINLKALVMFYIYPSFFISDVIFIFLSA